MVTIILFNIPVSNRSKQMGPPPDPEQMVSMLENPQFSAQLNEALSNPDVVEQM